MTILSNVFRKSSEADEITCVIPTLNECSTVAEVVQKAKLFANQVIVVDGYSEDNTPELAQEAGALGVMLVLENMWEPDPAIQRRVLESVHSPYLRACLDVGHARIYSKVPLETWIETFSPFLVYTHLHNTNGITDIHLRFDDGLIDMQALLNRLRTLPQPPTFCLELPDLAAIQASLKYLQLDRKR